MKKIFQISVLMVCFAHGFAWAERADRSKPINVEANTLTVDDDQHTQTLEGDVLLTQGTLSIRASKLVISEDRQGYQRAIATGGKNGKATFRQKREGRNDFIEGEAERIEYDARTEVAELFQRAWVKSGQDTIKGDYILYDAVAEKYRANGQVPGETRGTPGRVRAVIQAKGKVGQEDGPQPVDPGLSLQSTKTLRKK